MIFYTRIKSAQFQQIKQLYILGRIVKCKIPDFYMLHWSNMMVWILPFSIFLHLFVMYLEFSDQIKNRFPNLSLPLLTFVSLKSPLRYLESSRKYLIFDHQLFARNCVPEHWELRIGRGRAFCFSQCFVAALVPSQVNIYLMFPRNYQANRWTVFMIKHQICCLPSKREV